MNNLISIDADVLKALFAPNASFVQLRDAKHAARQAWDLWYAASLEPAMTTNPTIDGVPREAVAALGVLVETFRDSLFRGKQPTFSTGDLKHFITVMVELRALLDAPVAPVTPCAIADALESSQWPETSIGNKVLVAAAITELRKAAQPQGEPVALPERSFVGDIRNPYRHTVLHDGYISGWNAYQDAMVKLGPLYAEQPAPAEVVMPERKRAHCTGAISDFRTWEEAQGWNACLDELKRLNPSL